MRNMSFSMTTEAVHRREKTVTRRLGWWDLQPGTILQAVEKAQGLRKGEHVKPICLIRVVSVRRETLDSIYWEPAGTLAEGFPYWSPGVFIDFFCEANRGCWAGTLVNRIEFEYVEP